MIRSYLNDARCDDKKWNGIFNRDKMEYVCADCGDIYLTQKQRYVERIFTWHMGKCEMCGEETAVAHVRHFNWLRK